MINFLKNFFKCRLYHNYGKWSQYVRTTHWTSYGEDDYKTTEERQYRNCKDCNKEQDVLI